MSTIIKGIVCLLTFLILLSACNQQQPDQKAIEDLTTKIQEIKEKYRPGLGEYMVGIQLHHSKLWYAGINHNWKLANYEIDEIKEAFQNIKEVETNRPEVKTILIIEPALAKLTGAVAQKNEIEFKKSYDLLTNSCNNCHKANQYDFNVIITPTALPVNNQDFTAKP